MSQFPHIAVPQSISIDELAGQHPVDALYVLNPEFTAVALAEKAGWLSPDVLRILPTLRTAQAHENIEFLRSLVQKHAIDADERKNTIVQQTLESITRLQQEGNIAVESLRTDGLVKSETIRAQYALDALKLQYSMNHQMLVDQIEGKKYLARLQAEALHKEAGAQRDAIIAVEKMRVAAYGQRTEAELTAVIKSYEAKLYEAENLRKIERKKDISAIIRTHLFLQTQILRDSLLVEAEKAKATSASYVASSASLADAIKAGADVLKSTHAKKIRIYGSTDVSKIDVHLEVE